MYISKFYFLESTLIRVKEFILFSIFNLTNSFWISVNLTTNLIYVKSLDTKFILIYFVFNFQSNLFSYQNTFCVWFGVNCFFD